MLNPTQKLTDLFTTLNGQKVGALEQTLTKVVQDLTARAEELDLEFNPETLNAGLYDEQFGAEAINNYFEIRMEIEEARDSREEALKALKVGAGVAIGATVTGLLWREANRRGWTARATRAIEARKTVAAIQKRHGKVAALAARLALSGKITGVQFPQSSTLVPIKVTCWVNRDGITVVTDDETKTIPYDAIVGIGKTRTITQSHESEGFNLLLEHSNE